LPCPPSPQASTTSSPSSGWTKTPEQVDGFDRNRWTKTPGTVTGPGDSDRLVSGWFTGGVEDGTVGGLDRGLVLDGQHLGQDVAAAVDGTTLSGAVRQDEFDRADRSGGGVGDDR